jgi:nicotinamide-nucleotide amidase
MAAVGLAAVKAEILAIGSELLEPPREETNGPFLTEQLRAMGIEVVARQVVADELPLLESAFRAALARVDLVVATGGLGPTEDDLTREAAAAALGRPLGRDQAIVTALRERFATRGRPMAVVNEKQADVIQGAQVLPNAHGTAPGQRVDLAAQLLFLLPGPPSEMHPMFETHVRPALAAHAGSTVLRTRVLHIAGLPESEVEQLAAPIYKTTTNPRTTILASAGDVELRLTATGTPQEAEARVSDLAQRLSAALGERVYSDDGRSLARVVADLMRGRGLTLAIAESCTGGLLSAELMTIPGASAFLERAFVTYSNLSKCEELGVAAALIETHGAVSEPVARAMAEGARSAAHTSYGIAITGIAGPDGGTPDKPVGLVYIALAGKSGERVTQLRLPSSGRERIRAHAVRVALEMLRREILKLTPFGQL